MNIEKFQNSKYYDDLLNEIIENAGENTNAKWNKINQKYHCYVDESKEKHNSLQYTHYFTVTSELMEGEMHIEMENGINNGTVINDISFDGGFKPTSRTVEVLKDIVLDSNFYENGSLLKMKVQAVLNANKDKLFEFHRKNNYDNYVTGGNTKIKMSCHTKEQLENMLEDVVNELCLSDGIIEEHGPLGTPPSELVRLVLEQKDKQIRMLKLGMKQI